MEDAGAAAGLALGPAEQTDSCPGDGSWVAFQAFQHLYKTRPAPWPKGAREGGTSGGLPLPLRLPPHPPPAGSPQGQRHLLGGGGMLPRAGWGGQAIRRPSPSTAPVTCSSLGLGLPPGKMGRGDTAPPTPPPSCRRDPTGQSSKSAWHRALHTAGAVSVSACVRAAFKTHTVWWG